jgi:hypothetical protein
MFKKSYVRGITTALVQSGHAAFPSEEMAAKVADHIADNIGELNLDQPVSSAETAKIANHVIEASNAFRERGHQPGPFAKMASLDALAKHAHAHAVDLMEKAAEGSNYVGGDKGNDMASSAEGKADEKDRPDSYATNARGHIVAEIPAAAQVGTESVQPAEPKNHPEGSNSLTEASKAASLSDLMKKVAISVDNPTKDTHYSAEAKADQKERPEGYARLPHQGALGNLMQMVGGDAVIGKELTHPQGPSNHPAGGNSLTEMSKKSSADNDPYIALFKKTAQEVAPHLPGGLTDDQKVAHIRSVMGLTTEEKAHYLVGLQKQAAEKVSGEVPPQFLQHMKGKEDKKDDKDEKKDDDKDDKGSKHDLPDFMKKKEGAAPDVDLASRLRAITQSVGAQ